MKKSFLILFVLLGLQACANNPNPVMAPLTPSPDFAPVYPLANEQSRPATGGIYGNRQSDAWFGRGRNYQVGDLVTVLLNESTQAARSQKTDVSREASNTAVPAGVAARVEKAIPLLSGINLNESTTASSGKGSADHRSHGGPIARLGLITVESQWQRRMARQDRHVPFGMAVVR